MSPRLIALGLALTALAGCFPFGDGSSEVGRALDGEESPSPIFRAARKVIQDGCVTCHGAFATYSQADWVTHGYIVPGNSSGSPLFAKLSANGGDMPLEGNLAPTDVEALRAWIDSLSPPAGPLPLPSPQPSPLPSATPSPHFPAARAVLQTACVACHSPFGRYSESEWIASGLIAPGDPGGSRIFQKLKANGGNMPVGGALASNQVEAIHDWIASLGTDPDGRPLDAASRRTDAAMHVLARNCLACHGEVQSGLLGTVPAYGEAVQAYLDSRDTLAANRYFIQNANLVVQGDAEASWLYRALNGYGDVSTMPKSEPELGPTDAKVLEDWINGLGE